MFAASTLMLSYWVSRTHRLHPLRASSRGTADNTAVHRTACIRRRPLPTSVTSRLDSPESRSRDHSLAPSPERTCSLLQATRGRDPYDVIGEFGGGGVITPPLPSLSHSLRLNPSDAVRSSPTRTHTRKHTHTAHARTHTAAQVPTVHFYHNDSPAWSGERGEPGSSCYREESRPGRPRRAEHP
jgi:hypothetical protein